MCKFPLETLDVFSATQVPVFCVLCLSIGGKMLSGDIPSKMFETVIVNCINVNNNFIVST